MNSSDKDDADFFPLLTKRGIRITRSDDSPPGVSGAELADKLSVEEIKRLSKWGAVTMGMNGMYPWDVEDFLNGLPNTD